jgi:hypothetical protein
MKRFRNFVDAHGKQLLVASAATLSMSAVGTTIGLHATGAASRDTPVSRPAAVGPTSGAARTQSVSYRPADGSTVENPGSTGTAPIHPTTTPTTSTPTTTKPTASPPSTTSSTATGSAGSTARLVPTGSVSNPAPAPATTTVPPASSGTAAASPNQLLAQALAGNVKLFGLSPSGNSAGISTVPALAAELDHRVQIVNIYMSWNEPLPVSSIAAITAQGAIPELTWEQWPGGGGVDQPNYSDATIASGASDSYVSSVAAAARAWGQPILLRYAHEMNGNWYPWSASVNGNTPASYVAAWRHVHDIFTAAGASNVLWVWAPNAGGPTPVNQVYPGDAYVDIIGMDGYNRGNGTTGYQAPSSVFSSLFSTVRALAPSKPVLITETGTSEQAGNKAAWLEQLFTYVHAQAGLIGVVYFDYGAWNLDSSPQAMAGAVEGLQGL